MYFSLQQALILRKPRETTSRCSDRRKVLVFNQSINNAVTLLLAIVEGWLPQQTIATGDSETASACHWYCVLRLYEYSRVGRKLRIYESPDLLGRGFSWDRDVQ